MIESECFKDINESKNEEAESLDLGDTTCQPAAKRERGFYRFLRRRVMVRRSVTMVWVFNVMC